MYKVLSTDEQQKFQTGSRRGERGGKPRYDLISIHGQKALAQHLAKGAEIYGERNWELGQPVSRFYEAALRHLMQWREGEDTEDHLAAVLFNIDGIIHMREEIALGNLPPELDDIRLGFRFVEQYKTFIGAAKTAMIDRFRDGEGLTYLELKHDYMHYFNSEEDFNKALDMARVFGIFYVWYNDGGERTPEYSIVEDESYNDYSYDDY